MDSILASPLVMGYFDKLTFHVKLVAEIISLASSAISSNVNSFSKLQFCAAKNVFILQIVGGNVLFTVTEAQSSHGSF